MPRKLETVKGHQIAPPRITAAGYWRIFLYLILPLLAAALLLDGLVYTIMRYGFDACVGLYC